MQSEPFFAMRNCNLFFHNISYFNTILGISEKKIPLRAKKLPLRAKGLKRQEIYFIIKA
jgi:hypothetical protein